MLHCLTANLPDVAYIHQTRNLQSHTLDCSSLTVQRTENHTRSCRKALPPLIHPTVNSTTFRFTCSVYPQIILCLFSLSRFTNAKKNQGSSSRNCHQIAPSTSTLNREKKGEKKSFLLICRQGYHDYRHFKAKLLIVDPSEGRGFNFHTLAKKLVLDLRCSAPQQHAWRGV